MENIDLLRFMVTERQELCLQTRVRVAPGAPPGILSSLLGFPFYRQTIEAERDRITCFRLHRWMAAEFRIRI